MALLLGAADRARQTQRGAAYAAGGQRALAAYGQRVGGAALRLAGAVGGAKK